MMQSIQLLTDSCTAFADKCVVGITANEDRIADLLGRSLKKVLRAAENRVKFGAKKSEKDKAKALTEKLQGHLDGHKLDSNKPKSDD